MADEWWTEPYAGGKMVPVPGFPRQLYPPDAAEKGHKPSEQGPDVEAYKRTVWRAGRWPGPATDFDRNFSKAFSHGKKGGNVGDSGIAGVQRQQKLSPTGWVGRDTFNTLRSIRVPEGPHKGEMAMDANAQNLIAEAYKMFNGDPEPDNPKPPEPTPPPTKTTRELALDAAISYLGYKENPANSNNTMFGQWYGVNYQPWCAIFCTYCYEVKAGGSPSFSKGWHYAYVPYIVADARMKKNGLSVTRDPMPGDMVCFDWRYDGTYDHVGIFEKWLSGRLQFQSVEGNTGTYNNSNGGEVMRRQRSIGQAAITFVRVAE